MCYAPIYDADDAIKGELCDNLELLIDPILISDVTCVTENLNGISGQDRSYYPQSIECHGVGNIHENGARLVIFAMENNVLIVGTLLQHKKIMNTAGYPRIKPLKIKSTIS